ncbi:hypothetical protein B0H21DRAFT_826804 [Amylocystis lapponica]|nr:hypothetical protein B0H21DRAFT_826804 [Amylocystis lapponica]
MASRTVQKSAIPITNPNVIKPSESNGILKDVEGRVGDIPYPSQQASEPPVIDRRTYLGSAPPHRCKATGKNGACWTWGGVSIKSVPPTSGLFSFSFLINLHLNHTALTSIPPEISKLRHLQLLDLSGNSLVAVPPELRVLTSLKELYVFDNHLTTLPPGLGTPHQLQTLGIEGNPTDASLKHIVQKEGTPALNLVGQAEREVFAADQGIETFSVMCYDILCEKAATERMYGYMLSAYSRMQLVVLVTLLSEWPSATTTVA